MYGYTNSIKSKAPCLEQLNQKQVCHNMVQCFLCTFQTCIALTNVICSQPLIVTCLPLYMFTNLIISL